MFGRQIFPSRSIFLAGLGSLIAVVVLVAYLQYRSQVNQRQYTELAVQQICERSAATAVAALQRQFEAAMFDTIEGIGHRQLKLYDLARAAAFFQRGTRVHAYVSDFFMWSEAQPAPLRQEVLFYRAAEEDGPIEVRMPSADGQPAGGLYRRPEGVAIRGVAQGMSIAQRSYAAFEQTIEGRPHQVVFHLLWDDGERSRLHTIIGYTVDMQQLGAGRFSVQLAETLTALLNPPPGRLPLTFALLDHAGTVVQGQRPPADTPSAVQPLEMLFLPRDAFRGWIIGEPAGPRWQLVVFPARPLPAAGINGYWLVVSVVVLLLIAVACAVFLNRQAVRLSELQSDFVANVSHQLRTPLAMLSAAAETLTLERVRSPEKIKTYADIVSAQAKRLAVHVDQILHFHHADARATYARERVSLQAVAQTALQGFTPLLDRAGVTIQFDPGTTPPVVYGDAAALEQVIVNLVDNAVKYSTAPADIRVRLGVIRHYGLVAVCDEGPGIARQDRAHIFDKFYRGRFRGSGPRRGFGLGLTIVQAIVAAHGGRVEVNSEPDKGSEFRVLLPLVKEGV